MTMSLPCRASHVHSSTSSQRRSTNASWTRSMQRRQQFPRKLRPAAPRHPRRSTSERKRRRTDPWRIVSETCAAREKNIKRTHNIESCRRLFQNQAKAKALTPDQALFLYYLLYGTHDGRVFIAATLLTAPYDDARFERIRAHNFYVAHGTDDLQFPLYPVDTEFELLNQ
eukprot:PhM_4_TR14270/c2_g1_i3/m.4928